MSVQAIVRQTTTVAATFTGTPSIELRKQMKTNGYDYRNGQWFKSETVSHIVNEAEAAQYLAA